MGDNSRDWVLRVLISPSSSLKLFTQIKVVISYPQDFHSRILCNGRHRLYYRVGTSDYCLHGCVVCQNIMAVRIDIDTDRVTTEKSAPSPRRAAMGRGTGRSASTGTVNRRWFQ